MPNLKLIKNNLNGGEISPLSLGRTDLERYAACCEKMSNWIPSIQGGVVRRPGTRFITPAMGPSRLIPFVFSIAASYVLEFGNGVIRFYTNDSQIQTSPGIPYTIVTPYNTTSDDLWDIKYAQIGNTMYLTHPNHAPMKLTRVADNNWTLSAPSLYAPPTKAFDQDITQGTITCTLSATSGSSVTATASTPVFIAGDIGRAIVSGTGVGYITALSGTTVVDGTTGATLYPIATLLVINAFPSTSLGINWKMRGSPQGFLGIGKYGAGPVWINSRKRGLGQQISVYTFESYPVDGTAPPPETDCFRIIDLGSYIVVDGAVLHINVLNSASHAICTQITTFSVFIGVGPNNIQVPSPSSGGEWTVETPAFGGVHGFPRAVCFFHDRLFFASTADQPQSIWGSAVDDFENFGKGNLDDSALAFTISSGQFEQILWLQPFQGGIVAGTYAGEYIINGGGGLSVSGTDNALTPTTVSVFLQSTFGSDRIQPTVVQNDLIYIQKAKKTAYQFTFNIYQSVYASKNLNLLNNIITETGLKEMIYAQTPFFTVFFTDLAGNLIGLVYEKVNDVWGWFRCPTGADKGDHVTSICTIPTNLAGVTTDEVWMLTSRVVNGTIVYYIELMDLSLQVDCGSHSIFPNPITQVGNLQYLQGRVVSIIADGVDYGDVTMDGTGIFNFPPGITAIDVQAGLNYAALAVTVRPEVTAGGQSIQGLIKGWDTLFARVDSTRTLNLNGTDIDFRTLSTAVLGDAASLFSGDVRIVNLGNDRDGKVSFETDRPLAATVLCLFGQIGIGSL